MRAGFEVKIEGSFSLAEVTESGVVRILCVLRPIHTPARLSHIDITIGVRSQRLASRRLGDPGSKALTVNEGALIGSQTHLTTIASGCARREG
jgi:hypothetical protein